MQPTNLTVCLPIAMYFYMVLAILNLFSSHFFFHIHFESQVLELGVSPLQYSIFTFFLPLYIFCMY